VHASEKEEEGQTIRKPSQCEYEGEGRGEENIWRKMSQKTVVKEKKKKSQQRSESKRELY